MCIGFMPQQEVLLKRMTTIICKSRNQSQMCRIVSPCGDRDISGRNMDVKEITVFLKTTRVGDVLLMICWLWRLLQGLWSLLL